MSSHFTENALKSRILVYLRLSFGAWKVIFNVLIVANVGAMKLNIQSMYFTETSEAYSLDLTFEYSYSRFFPSLYSTFLTT